MQCSNPLSIGSYGPSDGLRNICEIVCDASRFLNHIQLMTNHASVQESNDQVPRQQKVIRGISFSPSRLLADLAELVQYRDLILTLSVHRLRVRYKQVAKLLMFPLDRFPWCWLLSFTLKMITIASIPSFFTHFGRQR